VRLSAGNENEQRHLLPLVDELLERGLRPLEVWADRGYAAKAIDEALRQREIEPRISKPRRAGDPIAEGTPTREVWRGKKRRIKTRDPLARHRWPVERTNAWLRRFRRLTIRTEPNSRVYLAYLTLALIIILGRAL